MKKVLITGATGNVGSEVIKSLQSFVHQLDVYAGVRDIASAQPGLDNIKFAIFDFTDARTYPPALEGCNILFLLRPPQISEVEKYFRPIVDTCIAKGVQHIVFLSVQGVEKSSIIPHHKIEQLIVDSKIPYTFLRPAYFMQNFTTTLRGDLVNKQLIYLPAGNAKFTLVDVRDTGLVAANVLANTAQHKNVAYDLTSKEKLTFGQMAEMMNKVLGTNIRYVSPNLFSFFLTKRKEKVPTMLISVMIMLHYLPRFQKDPEITDWVEKITGREPISFEQFIVDNRKGLLGS